LKPKDGKNSGGRGEISDHSSVTWLSKRPWERLKKTDERLPEIIEHSPNLVRFNVPPGKDDDEDAGSVPIHQSRCSYTSYRGLILDVLPADFNLVGDGKLWSGGKGRRALSLNMCSLMNGHGGPPQARRHARFRRWFSTQKPLLYR
jgi:hypothetical protein